MDEVTHDGTYYRMQAATCAPKTVQQPHPPFLIAGGGPQIQTHLRRVRKELGITYFCLRGPDVERLGPIVRELAGT